MRLTVYTDYALRMLMYLALKDDGLATIEEIAQSYGISKNHLMKVAHQLGRRRIRRYRPRQKWRIASGKTSKGNRTRRGCTAYGTRHGHRDVFRAHQTPIARSCPIAYCARPWTRARTAFVEALDDYALSDLVKPRASLQAMLSIAPVKATRASTAKPKRERLAKR